MELLSHMGDVCDYHLDKYVQLAKVEATFENTHYALQEIYNLVTDATVLTTRATATSRSTSAPKAPPDIAAIGSPTKPPSALQTASFPKTTRRDQCVPVFLGNLCKPSTVLPLLPKA
jgi:hypothetical protein